MSNDIAGRYAGVRALVTGGGGFIGSRLIERLVDAGADVSVIVRKKALAWRLERVIGDCTVYEADLIDLHATQQIMAQSRPEVVFNAAGSTDTRRTFDILDAVVQNTYDVAKSVVTACVNVGVRKFVHLGTYEEYGTAGAPFLENTREAPISPYSLSKVMAAHTVLLAGKLTPLTVSVVRLAATFGPRQGHTMLIPNLIKAGIEERDFDMNDGKQVRDFLYIEDAVEGILQAGLSEQANGEIINLGSGKGTKVRDIAETVHTALGAEMRINFGAHTYRPLDGSLCYMSNNKAKRILRWEPATATIDAIRETVDWYREHLKDGLL
jgi:nucleoside-diphosphate-sugar epimerase